MSPCAPRRWSCPHCPPYGRAAGGGAAGPTAGALRQRTSGPEKHTHTYTHTYRHAERETHTHTHTHTCPREKQTHTHTHTHTHTPHTGPRETQTARQQPCRRLS